MVKPKPVIEISSYIRTSNPSSWQVWKQYCCSSVKDGPAAVLLARSPLPVSPVPLANARLFQGITDIMMNLREVKKYYVLMYLKYAKQLTYICGSMKESTEKEDPV